MQILTISNIVFQIVCAVLMHIILLDNIFTKILCTYQVYFFKVKDKKYILSCFKSILKFIFNNNKLKPHFIQ